MTPRQRRFYWAEEFIDLGLIAVLIWCLQGREWSRDWLWIVVAVIGVVVVSTDFWSVWRKLRDDKS